MEWVRYGRPAASSLRAAISGAKAGDPLAPVSVVVPSNQVGVAARRLLASGELGPICERGSGLAAVSFLTVYRLAELLGAAPLAAAGRRPVSTPVLAAALRGVLAADPGVFAPVAEHPATEMALVAAYKELRDASPDALDAVATRSPRAADVVRLFRAARTRLEPQWYDEEDLISAALGAIGADGADRHHLGTTVVYLPERLTRHGASLLASLATSHEVLVLAGTTADPGADADVVRSVGRLDPHGDTPSPPAGSDALDIVAAGRTRMVTTSDPDEEVRAAVRAVVDAVRAGTPLERMAVLHASPEPYARLVHEQLAGAGIAHNGAAVAPLTARVAGRTLLGLLELPGRGVRRDDVFAWLAGAPLLHHGHLAPVTAWERLSRDAGVVAGRLQWDLLLETFAADCEAEAAAAEDDADAPAWLVEKLRGDATRARELRGFMLALVDDLADAATSTRAWSERAEWARGLLRRLLGGERRRAGWPVVEQKAFERVEQAIDRLARLDAVEGPTSLEVFARTFELELEADLGRVGRMGEGVLVGSVRMGVGLDLDLVVILGLAEGTFPTPYGDDSLLPDHERQAAGGQLALRADAIERQHRELLATLAGSSRQLLCVPRGDLRRSSVRVPSRWALDIAGTLAGRRLWSEDLPGVRADWLDHVASYDAGLRAMAFPASAQEHRLRALLALGAGPGAPAALSALGDPVASAGAEAVAERRSHRFTRFDGNLAGLAVPSPAQQPISATRLEGWAVCPFAYLMNSILGVEAVENPEDRLAISPLDLGSLVHEILERFVEEVLARPASAQPAPGDAWSSDDRARMHAIAEEVCDRYEAHGLVGRTIFWQRDRRRIAADLDRFLGLDSARRAEHGTRPVAAELAFGLRHAATGPVSLPLPDGRSVAFRGKADRLDAADDGSLEVLDYKTGSARRYAGLDEANPDSRGTHLQLVVYALAARRHRGTPDAPVRAEYWFTSSKGDFKRIGYPVTPEVLATVSTTVGRMVDGIEAGVFPNHPTRTSSSPFVECAYCDPDGLGVVDLHRRIDAKRADAALAMYLDLADPPAPEAGADDGDAGG